LAAEAEANKASQKWSNAKSKSMLVVEAEANANDDGSTKKTLAVLVELQNTSTCVGWPKGSSDAAAKELVEKIEQVTKEAVHELKQLQSQSKSSKKRLGKGSLSTQWAW
jgi:hypothetical protein